MTFLLVPHAATATTATVWVGAIDEDVRAKRVGVEFSSEDDGGGTIELDASAWQRWKSYHPLDRPSFNPRALLLPKSDPEVKRLYYQRITIGSERDRPLKPRTSYALKLLIDGQTVSTEDLNGTARVATLPEELPSEERDAFTLLLGSCFYGPEDRDGLVGKTYYHMDKKPDIKVLCGDQVYLDNPWRETTFSWNRSYSQPGLFRATLLKRYEYNWTQVEGEDKDAGFRQLLRDGANYFCSDDHEFWNNAPNFGGVALRHTLRRSQRDWWFREALVLFRAFQSPSPVVWFEVEPLSFCIADTRINRDVRGTQFMDDDDLEDVKRWIEGLKGPAVLVVGQPLLARENVIRSLRNEGLIGGLKPLLGRGGFLGGIRKLPGDLTSFLMDKDLPDYRRQYDELMGCIKGSDHSIVVLTGDVHFGRVAYGELESASGSKFVEVIASPMKLVPTPKWNWSSLKPEDKPIYGTYHEVTQTDIFPNLESEEVAPEQDHFATLEFFVDESARAVNMTVRSWPIQHPEHWPVSGPEGKASPESDEVCRIALPLRGT